MTETTPMPVQFPVIDPAEADKFIALFGTRICAFQTFDDSPEKRPGRERIFHGTREMYHAALVDLQRDGAGIYFTVNETDGLGRKAKNIVRVRAYFADGDGMPLEDIWRLKLYPTCIVESSPGKFNAFYLIEDAPELAPPKTAGRDAHFKRTQQQLAALFGSDTAVNDLPRVMRLPGFLHQKDPSKPFMSRIHYINPDARYAEVQFQEALAAALERHPPPAPVQAMPAPKPTNLPPIAASLIGDKEPKEPAPDPTPEEINKLRSALQYIDPSNYTNGFDSKNPGWFEGCCAVKSTGWPDATVLDIVDEWSKRTTRNNYPGRDAVWNKLCKDIKADRDGITERTIYKVARERGWVEPLVQQTIVSPPIVLGSTSVVRAPGLLDGLWWHGTGDTNAMSVPWLIKNMLPQTGVALISGQWGMRKTFVAVDITYSVGRGNPVANYKCKRPGGVFYIAAEGAQFIPNRIRALDEKFKLDKRTLPLAFLDWCPPMAPQQAPAFSLLDLCKAVAEEMPKRHGGVPLVLIIIDTLSAAHPFKDANDAAEAQKVMNYLNEVSRQTGALVAAVDHYGKDTEAGTRGSSAKEASADAVVAVLGERSPAGVISKSRIAIRKARGGAQGAETFFTLQEVPLGIDEDGDPITACTVEWLQEAPKIAHVDRGDAWPKASRQLRRVMTDLLGNPNRVWWFSVDGQEERTQAVKYEDVRAEFYKACPDDGSKDPAGARRKKFNRAVEDAQDAGLIATKEDREIRFVWFAKGSHGAKATIPREISFKPFKGAGARQTYPALPGGTSGTPS